MEKTSFFNFLNSPQGARLRAVLTQSLLIVSVGACGSKIAQERNGGALRASNAKTYQAGDDRCTDTFLDAYNSTLAIYKTGTQQFKATKSVADLDAAQSALETLHTDYPKLICSAIQSGDPSGQLKPLDVNAVYLQLSEEIAVLRANK